MWNSRIFRFTAIGCGYFGADCAKDRGESQTHSFENRPTGPLMTAHKAAPTLLRIAVAQLNPTVGNVDGNLARARTARAEAAMASI